MAPTNRATLIIDTVKVIGTYFHALSLMTSGLARWRMDVETVPEGHGVPKK